MKTEMVAEKLSLERMLNGTNLFNSLGSMIFSLYLEVKYVTFGQLVWIQKNLPTWAKLLDEKSGASVAFLAAEENRKENYERGLAVTISLRMFIRGDICDWQITDREVSKMFCGGIKKMLAKKIEENFPPPFDFQKPLFAAGVDDAYLVYSKVHYRELDELAIKRLFSQEVKTEARILANDFGAELVSVKENAERLRGLNYHHFVIQWRENADENRRFHFSLELRNLLERHRIPCSVKKYEESPSIH